MPSRSLKASTEMYITSSNRRGLNSVCVFVNLLLNFNINDWKLKLTLCNIGLCKEFTVGNFEGQETISVNNNILRLWDKYENVTHFTVASRGISLKQWTIGHWTLDKINLFSCQP